MSDKKRKPKTSGLEVIVNYTGDFKKDRAALDAALRDFKKKIKKSEIMDELRERESYMNPSLKRRYRKNEAIKRRKRDERKLQWSRNESDV